MSCRFFLFLAFGCCAISSAQASVTIPLTVNLSEAVTVTGTPRVAVDVGGQTRYATYTAGTGTTALTFTLTPQAGDVDLDGIAVSSPIDLNGGTIKDLAGNNLAALTFTPPNTSGIKVNYPSLGMDFAYDADGRYTLNGTAYNDLPSFLTAAGGTFTRTSTATYFDSTGTLQTALANTPRFDYDPVTHTPKGLLIEESRTNYSYPSGTANMHYSYANAIPSGVLAPDGVTLAEVNTFDQPSGGRFFKDFNPSGNNTYTVSVFVRGVSGSTVTQAELRLKDYQTDTIRGQSGLVSLSTSEWTRVTATGTTAGSTAGLRFEVGVNSSGSSAKMLVWGNQTEVGSSPTSYIPTTTAAVTRGADFLSLPVGAWHNASEGAIYAQTSSFNTDSAKVTAFASFDDNTNNNRLQFRRAAASTVNFRIVAGGSSIVDGNSTALWTDSSFHKYAAGYKSANNKVYFDGTSAINFLAASAMPTVTQLQIGGGPGSSALNGYLKALKYYPTRVPDAQLQLLTQ